MRIIDLSSDVCSSDLKGPRNRARWRIATARTRAVAFDGARPAHAPDVAPVLRVGPYGQDGGRIDQGGRGRALIGGGLADGCAQTLHKDAPGAVARLPRPATAVAPRHGHGGRRIPETGHGGTGNRRSA